MAYPKQMTISAPISNKNPWKVQLTPYQRFKQDPALFIAQWLYARRPRIAQPVLDSSKSKITVVCISDTHNTTPELPNGDILLHAGDLTVKGLFNELQAQLTWLNSLPHKHKVVIGGNHDLLLDTEFVERFPERIMEREGSSRADLDWGNVIYLNNTSATLNVGERDIKIFGSPLTPQSGNWAFQYPPIRDVWNDKVPEGTDILLTHGPPKGHLDCYLGSKGCDLLVRELWRKRPKLIVFGHIHAGRGREHVKWDFLHRAYDGVIIGEWGMFGVMLMASAWAIMKAWGKVTGRERKGDSTFVNAAVVGGIANVESHPAKMVEI